MSSDFTKALAPVQCNMRAGINKLTRMSQFAAKSHFKTGPTSWFYSPAGSIVRDGLV